MEKKLKQKLGTPLKTTLTVPLSEAEEKINERILAGQEMMSESIISDKQLEVCKLKFEKWNKYNITLLNTLFSTDEVSQEYDEAYPIAFNMAPDILELISYHKNSIKIDINRLESICERLSFYEVPAAAHKVAHSAVEGNPNTSVFVVHGRDDGHKNSVARFLSGAGLDPIILHEQANKGRTLLEKFEANSEVGYAVVILTGDDAGGLKIDEESVNMQPRARQNVLFEWGYFCALLGRDRVCALYEHGVELPSDLDGLVWVSLADEAAWKVKLAQELKAADFEIDMNKLKF